MFFQDKQGEFHPINRIVSMRRSYKYRGNDEIHPAKVYLTDSSVDGCNVSLKVDDDTIEEILDQTQPCISAHPGSFVLEFCCFGDEDGEPFVDRHPVLGWRVDGAGGLHPLLFDGRNVRISGINALLNSNGNVQDLFGSMYDDQDAWFQTVLKQHQEAIETRRAAKQQSSTVES
jgi:hypothetical protein